MNLKPVKIGNKFVGDGYACYVIAEIGSNFDGSLSRAKKLIKTAKECGANAAKFQSFKTEKLLSKKGFKKKSTFQSKWKKSVWEVYKNAELPRAWHKKLKEYADHIGIDFFTSPWDFEALAIIQKLKVPAIKIGSGDITYHELLSRAGSTGKPILLATGASTLEEVKQAINVIKSTGNKKIILLHSVVQYPSPIEEANLKVLNNLRNKFKLNVGYSDHSSGSLIALASVVLGSCVIEKHFSLDPKSLGPDHSHSMDPKSFRKMVDEIRLLEKAMGHGIKKPFPSENETRIIQRRGIWTVKDISKGEIFNEENIKPLRPVLGISAAKYKFLLGKKSKKKFKAYEKIIEKDI